MSVECWYILNLHCYSPDYLPTGCPSYSLKNCPRSTFKVRQGKNDKGIQQRPIGNYQNSTFDDMLSCFSTKFALYRKSLYSSL